MQLATNQINKLILSTLRAFFLMSLFLLSMSAANASLINYEFSFSGSPNQSVTGTFQYDDTSSAALDGFINLDEFTDLTFIVTNTNGTGSGNLAGIGVVNFFPWGNLFSYELATNSLLVTNVIQISLWDQVSGAYFLSAVNFFQSSPSTQGYCQLCVTESVTFSSNVTLQEVPAPATLSLLALSLVGLRLSKRNKA